MVPHTAFFSSVAQLQFLGPWNVYKTLVAVEYLSMVIYLIPFNLDSVSHSVEGRAFLKGYRCLWCGFWSRGKAGALMKYISVIVINIVVHDILFWVSWKDWELGAPSCNSSAPICGIGSWKHLEMAASLAVVSHSVLFDSYLKSLEYGDQEISGEVSPTGCQYLVL